MTTLTKNWFKHLFIHHASSNVGLKISTSNQSCDKNVHSTLGQKINVIRNSSINEKMTDRCTIVEKPLNVCDVDQLYHNNRNEQQKIEYYSVKNSMNMKLAKPKTIVIDKFKMCFLDCMCQCEVR